MFKYQKLATQLKTLITKKSQLKDIIYSASIGKESKGPIVNPAVAYSNLSLILNNLGKFEEYYRVLLKKSTEKITNKYLLFVMVA